MWELLQVRHEPLVRTLRHVALVAQGRQWATRLESPVNRRSCEFLDPRPSLRADRN